MTEKLKAKLRDVVGKKVKQFREQDLIPAVIYGHGKEAQNLFVNFLDFKRVYEKAGESAIIELDLEGKKLNVLIHEVQNDNMNGKFSHIDFFEVSMDKEVETEIPLEFIGESEAVKALGGVLVKNMDTIPVKCLPADLPSEYKVDISKLVTFDDHITVADLKTSAKVEIMLEDETVIALVSEPRSEAELESLEQKVEEDVSKVEGVTKEAANGEQK